MSESGNKQRIAELERALKAAEMLIREYRMAFDDYGLFLGTDNKSIDEIITGALANQWNDKEGK